MIYMDCECCDKPNVIVKNKIVDDNNNNIKNKNLLLIEYNKTLNYDWMLW
jgi:hypothetical protein